MGMLFISVIKLLESLNPILKINIDLLLACPLFLLKLEIVVIMVYVMWVLVLVQYLIPYKKKKN